MPLEPKAEEATVAARAEAGVNRKDVDDAWAFLESHGAPSHVANEKDLKAIRRKVDLALLPLLLAAYTLQFIDKALLNVCHCVPLVVYPRS